MKYINKPVTIEAIQWTGENKEEIMEFVGSNIVNFCGAPLIEDGCLWIRTLDGERRACTGDYIIKDIHGEFYPCKPDVFVETYEKME